MNLSMRHVLARFACMAIAAGAVPGMVRADAGDSDPALAVSAEYRADGVHVARGASHGSRYVDYLSLSADLLLDKAAGWHGARLFAQGLASSGSTPNDLAGTMQGINNSEVEERRAKLFQLWFEQTLPVSLPISIRLGFSDLNSEFYATDASALLLAPAFGIGSELSATGPNGPSLFPSTALGARVRLEPADGIYAQLAVLNAEAGVLGDRGGIRPLFGKGALLIAEGGTTRAGKLALGLWTYTGRQPDLTKLDPSGSPRRRKARGAYVLLQRPLAGHEVGSGIDLFVRAGLSEGHTTPYHGGWQAGMIAHGIIPSRDDSQLSIGINQAFLTGRYRKSVFQPGDRQRVTETGLELTFADKPAPWITVQPDVQWVRSALRGPGVHDATIFTLRLTLAPQRP